MTTATEHRPGDHTFIARSAKNPSHSVTFTLVGSALHVDLAALIEVAREAAGKMHDEGAADAAAQIERQVLPAAAAGLKRLAGPFPLRDVTIGGTGAALELTVWPRAMGLRVAPLSLSFTAVDDPQGAEEFRDEARRRQEGAEPQARFPGVFDYWAAWGVLGLAAIALLIGLRGPKPRRD